MKKATKFITLLCASLLILATVSSCDLFKTEDESEPINVTVLSGTTGFGAAKLISDSKDGDTAQSYSFTVETDPSLARDGLINGSVDIAALPTNVAATLYNKTGGEVVLLALYTRGVLYLVANTAKASAPATLSDLVGKTVYVPAQNPAFVTQALLNKAEIEGVTLDSTTYAEPAALRDAVASGLVDYAVLPEPMVTIAVSKATQANAGVTLSVALDLTTEWKTAFGSDSLVQGCIVARQSFVDNHP